MGEVEGMLAHEHPKNLNYTDSHYIAANLTGELL